MWIADGRSGDPVALPSLRGVIFRQFLSTLTG
jgi:hypothetical protein